MEGRRQPSTSVHSVCTGFGEGGSPAQTWLSQAPPPQLQGSQAWVGERGNPSTPTPGCRRIPLQKLRAPCNFPCNKSILVTGMLRVLLGLFYSVHVLNFFRYGYMAFRVLRFKKSYCYYVEHYKIVYLISLVLLALRDYCAYAIKKGIPMRPVQVFLIFW